MSLHPEFTEVMQINAASYEGLDHNAIEGLWVWLDQADAQDIAYFGTPTADQNAQMVDRIRALSQHSCVNLIRESLMRVTSILRGQSELTVFETQMREIDGLLGQCMRQLPNLKTQIDLGEQLKKVVKSNITDLQLHEAALSLRLPTWQAQENADNPLDINIVRNSSAQRRIQSIMALLQSAQSSDVQLSLLYQQFSHLYENVGTLVQVTYPIWKQKAINQAMVYDAEFLSSLQDTLN